MPDKEVPISSAAHTAIQNFLAKYFLAEGYGARNLGPGQYFYDLSPSMKEKDHWEAACYTTEYVLVPFRNSYRIEVRLKPYNCTLVSFHWLKADSYGYPIESGTNPLTEAELTEICSKQKRPMSVTSFINWMMNHGSKVRMDNGLTLCRLDRKPLPKPKTEESTTLARLLTRRGIVPVDDVRLNQLADFLNEWAARENPKDTYIEVLEGADITAAYKNAIGSESCMVRERSILTELYAMNPDIVKLVVLRVSKTVAIGRALMWVTPDEKGKMTAYLDRIYPPQVKEQAMLLTKVEEWAKEKGYPFFSPHYSKQTSILPVLRLKMGKNRYCPYLDSYRAACRMNRGDELLAAPTATLLEKKKAELIKEGHWFSGDVLDGYVTAGTQFHTDHHRNPPADWVHPDEKPKPVPEDVPRPTVAAPELVTAAANQQRLPNPEQLGQYFEPEADRGIEDNPYIRNGRLDNPRQGFRRWPMPDQQANPIIDLRVRDFLRQMNLVVHAPLAPEDFAQIRDPEEI